VIGGDSARRLDDLGRHNYNDVCIPPFAHRNTMSRVALVLLGGITAGLFAGSAARCAEQVAPAAVQQFLAFHCSDCHGEGAEEGGFTLAELSRDPAASREPIDRWTRVFDRVAGGEMPPAEATAPSAEHRRSFLDSLRPYLETMHRERRETVLRRLNRVEYENTIRDLLQVEIELKDLLPEDQQAGGFDNNGEALALSAELMRRYLQAAQRSIDAAIADGERPPTETFTVSSAREVERYTPKQYQLIDDQVVVFSSNKTQYSKISTRGKRLPRQGRYRFRFEAAVHFGEEPIVFSVMASNFAGVEAEYRHLGFFEATGAPQAFEVEATLPEGFAIQFFALGLPGYVKDASTGEHPGVGFSPVTITGPLHEQWPPPSHIGLLGELDLQQASLDDAPAVLASLMRRAFRRPVAPDEVERYVALVRERLDAGRNFEESLRIAMTAVLCSPHFLYLREQSPAKASDQHPQQISQHELAARLSYFLWSSLPDAQLTRLADQGRLHDPEILHAQVDRMLADPRAERLVENFTGQWLLLRDIRDTTPDSKLYPDFDELLEHSMVQESRGFFRELLRQNRPLDNLLDSDFLLLNGPLAEHYGIEGVEGLQMRSVPRPAGSERGGVLTQAAVLKVTANGTNTSPVTRGVWVLENILGRPTPPPPPNIAGIEPDIRGATTIRQQLEQHRSVESCQSCHRQIDPPGFALEAFDPVGAIRTHYRRFVVNPKFKEQGWGSVQAVAEVDASGTLAGGQAFQDIRQLKQLLLDDRQAFAHCLTEKLLSYALGRELGFSDREAVQEIARHTADEGNGLRTLIHEIVVHRTFATH
jgi:hypothetical protein